VSSLEDAHEAWRKMQHQEAVLEAVVDFEAELSVVGVRSHEGDCAFFAPCANDHVNGILDVSASPVSFGPEVSEMAIEISRGILEQLGVTGVLCVEFFLTRDRRLLINELAPRPHNSGHLTIDCCVTSQFEQQLRAVCGLPLGSTAMLRPAAMANLLGDIWAGGEPDWASAVSLPDVKLHLYGKTEPRAGRKMGHLTATAESPAAASQLVRAARARLTV
jgi:5-(carboxyamino)imidazole ribonucleotide synthase